MPSLTVPRRFNGPPRSGNGGWTSGALAETLPGGRHGTAITVALRLPPPLDTPMPVTETPTGAVATHDGRVVAEARFAEVEPAPVRAVPVTEAAAAEARYPGRHRHPFPTCYACGPQRTPGDGLRIFPGPVVDGGRLPGHHADRPESERPAAVAATWMPYETSVPTTWAALDCIGGWATAIDERPMVLGTITLRIGRLPTTAERYVVVGADLGTEGRKTRTAATMYDPVGEVVATAEHVWIAVDPRSFDA